MKKIYTFIFVALVPSMFLAPFARAQSSPAVTANEYVKPYRENLEYGCNLGYFGNGWEDESLAAIINKAGGRTFRPSLPEFFLEKYGFGFNVNNFKTYVKELGMKDLTCFIGGPADAHKDLTIYPGSDKPSKLFANLYEPIWNADGSVNPKNYYALYVYKLIQTYGSYIRFWEVVNEPDYAYSYSIAEKWIDRAPLPREIPNVQAPIYNYIRTLRITWEVVKKYSPEDYVTTGGIGYTQFLDAILRYTDNPNRGLVSQQYPKKGGAYFDVLNYHVYPGFNMSKWDNSIGGFRYTRTSDYLAANVVDSKEEMNMVLKKYGYNGAVYPVKNFLLSEVNVSRRNAGDHIGSDEIQRNFGIKSLVLSQKSNIAQVYFFDVSESVDAPPAKDSVVGYDEFRLMGLFENLKRDKPGSEKITDFGTAFKTTSQLLHGLRYDAVRTAALHLPAATEGAAFNKDGKYVYVLWAKALTDKSEAANANFSFPADFGMKELFRYEWNYSLTGASSKQSSVSISLNGSPAFFSGEIINKLLDNQLINFPALAAKTFGAAPFTLNATASSGLPVTFKISSGPATISGNTLTITGAGNIVIEAMQKGNTNYYEAVSFSQTLIVSKAGQTINFPAVPARTFSNMPFKVSASASSGLPLSTRVVSGAATVSGNEVTLTGSGWVILEMSQAGDGNYKPASSVTQGFTVFKAGQTIRFAQIPSKVFGDAPFSVNASASSGLPVSFKILYGPATVSGNLVTLTSTGLVGVVASQAGNLAYSIAPNVTQSFSVYKATAATARLNSNLFSGGQADAVSGKPVISLEAGSKNQGITLTTFPIPFLNTINIQFTLQETEKVVVDLFDLQGKKVRQIYSGIVHSAIPQNLVLESTGLSNSMYILQLSTNKKVFTKKIVLTK